jgi:hypothetical protein
MFTKEQLQDMARCSELVCSECRAKVRYCIDIGLPEVIEKLAAQLLSTMDRLEQLEKELLFREVSPNE